MSTALWIALLLAAPAPPSDQARALTRRSMLEYDTGHYEKALADIEQAYELDPRPALLFNVGQCHRALGQYREAALAFKSYLREVPDAKNREEAADLCAKMSELARRSEAAQKAHPQPAPVAVAPPPHPAPQPAPVATAPEQISPSWTEGGAPSSAPEAAVTAPEGGAHVPSGAWWLGGSGLVVGVAGTILFGLGEATLGGDNHTTLPSGAVQHSLSASTFFGAATEANTGEVLWCVGGALLVTGVIVAFTGGSK